jgi:hypothetical protein
VAAGNLTVAEGGDGVLGASLEELRRLWVEQVRTSMPAETARRAVATATDAFEDVTDSMRDAARHRIGDSIPSTSGLRACTAWERCPGAVVSIGCIGVIDKEHPGRRVVKGPQRLPGGADGHNVSLRD